ncbi:SENP1 [Mytilus coruscus]|uniref:SENP1 n=1 Tax=Mytilus coruscus TaxID=42192 RepID=A0A6J8BBR6_MYTCO|nr:SENP1 [Mytilus coruscus]
MVCYNDELVNIEDKGIMTDTSIQSNAYILYYEQTELVSKIREGSLSEKDPVIGKIGSIVLYESNLECLDDGRWLNDQVVQSKNQTVFVLDSSGEQTRRQSLYKKEFSIDLSYTKKLKHKISLQENGYDCGVFVLLYSEALAGGQSLCFTKNEIATARQRIRQRIMKAVIKSI